MTVLIIEDEQQAARRLESLVLELNPATTVLARLDSVSQSVRWLKSNPTPDIILMDIQLGDGLSFEIFEQVKVTSPVIFTTAYDEYALKAFKVNSIDYLLKPVDKEDLRAALVKYESLAQRASGVLTSNLEQVVQLLTRKHKERFVIKVGEHLRTIETRDILYFYSQDKATFCYAGDQRTWILDFTLEQLETMTDPYQFFRINRQYLVRASAIRDIIQYTNSRLKLVLDGSKDHAIIVARERVQDFRAWLDR